MRQFAWIIVGFVWLNVMGLFIHQGIKRIVKYIRRPKVAAR